ncbi:TniB family NTP-binding protein [Cereibacter sphaeroides]|uniref:TniB family NTP-binding protein n=1 Tax=Cereibacter sphaeroides TaxID=1063 RepID=UPI001F285562|nr:TniB family NTP-binding protein [Cereibacter sphaeroides]MCE6950293.1 TniB family NTP-binding protein [Cereibacter sphaeroides]
MTLIPAEAAARLAVLRSIHVPTRRDKDLRLHLDRLLKTDVDGLPTAEPIRFTANMETRGIALIEPAGGGKTTAIQHVLSSTPALNPAEGGVRYLSVQVPSPATLKSLGLAILQSAGVGGVHDRAKVWQIWDAVRHRMSKAGIVLLWIDEAHDLFLSRSSREIDDMLKMLKALMQGDAAVIVVLSGTERLSEITAYDPQVNRRFTKIVPRELDQCKSGKMVDLIGDFARRAGLQFETGGEIGGRLIHGSRGRFGRAVETAINAIEQALLDSADTLTLDHFAEAWARQEGCRTEDNVFLADNWSAITLDSAAQEFEADRSARLKKQREKS